MPPAHPPLPAHRPRLVATDLDGTLLRSDGGLSLRTRAALIAAEEAGIEVIFVTARPPRWVSPLADAVGPHGYVIAGNGAFVLDLHNGALVEERGFGRDDLLALAGDLRAKVPGVGLAIERRCGMTYEEGFRSPHDEDLAEGVGVRAFADLADLDEVPTGKLLAVVPGEHGEGFIADVAAAVGERGIVAYSGVGFLAEISPPGVTKAAALERWCSARGISADQVWAFGDMPNDLPMLGWAGTSFAVANAHDDVLALATHRCPSNDDDGVAITLESALGS